MAFTDPENNIKQFGLVEGARVADLGSGSGFYVIAAARKVGEDGRVYAVDVQGDLLSRVKNLAESEGLDNVDVMKGDLENYGGSGLADSSVDVVFISNTLFQVENKNALIKEARRILRDSGRVLCIDWKDSFSGLGPTQEQVVPQFRARQLFEDEGFEYEKDIIAGEHHYGMVMRKIKLI